MNQFGYEPSGQANLQQRLANQRKKEQLKEELQDNLRAMLKKRNSYKVDDMIAEHARKVSVLSGAIDEQAAEELNKQRKAKNERLEAVET